MFLYWGRRGLTQFALEVARAARADSDLAATISLSRQNENIAAFRELGESLFLIDTFSSNIGVLTQSWRIPSLRQQLLTRMRSDRTDVVIDLMPHVWSSLMVTAIQSAGASYVPIVHDAAAHPGDYRTRWVKRILDQSLLRADRVLTLSRAVARQLIDTRRVSEGQGRHAVPSGPGLWHARRQAHRPAGQPVSADVHGTHHAVQGLVAVSRCGRSVAPGRHHGGGRRLRRGRARRGCRAPVGDGRGSGQPLAQRRRDRGHPAAVRRGGAIAHRSQPVGSCRGWLHSAPGCRSSRRRSAGSSSR